MHLSKSTCCRLFSEKNHVGFKMDSPKLHRHMLRDLLRLKSPQEYLIALGKENETKKKLWLLIQKWCQFHVLKMCQLSHSQEVYLLQKESIHLLNQLIITIKKRRIQQLNNYTRNLKKRSWKYEAQFNNIIIWRICALEKLFYMSCCVYKTWK